MKVDSGFAPPKVWVAQALRRSSKPPHSRIVVVVPSERHAHEIRRHVCVDLGRPQDLAGVEFPRPEELAREVLLRSGVVAKRGWESVRLHRIVEAFRQSSISFRYFDVNQLRASEGYADAFATTIYNLEKSGYTHELLKELSDRISDRDKLAALRLSDIARIWQEADRDPSSTPITMMSSAQIMVAATAALHEDPSLAYWDHALVLILNSPSALFLRFIAALPECSRFLQDALPLRRETQRWRSMIDLEQPERSDAAGEKMECQIVRRYFFEAPEKLAQPDRPRSRGEDGSVTLSEYSGVDEEIAAAISWVWQQISQGHPLSGIALIIPEEEPFSRLLFEGLQESRAGSGMEGLSAVIAGGLSVLNSALGKRLSLLIEVLQSRLDVRKTLRIVPALRRRDQANDAPYRLSISRATEIVRDAGIAGVDPAGNQWLRKLSACCDEKRRIVEECEVALGEEKAEQRSLEMKRSAALRWLKDVEASLPAIAALEELARGVVEDAPLASIAPSFFSFVRKHLRLPLASTELLSLVEEQVQAPLADELSAAISGRRSLAVLSHALRRARYTTARFGVPAVYIGTPARTAGLSFEAIRFVGLAEGSLPSTPHDDPILPDDLCSLLDEYRKGSELLVGRLHDRMLDDLQNVFRVVQGAGRSLAFSSPRQWVDRSEREVSGLMLEVATALGRRGDGDNDSSDVPSVERLRALYLQRGRVELQEWMGRQMIGARSLLAKVASSDLRDGSAIHIPLSWSEDEANSAMRASELMVSPSSPPGVFRDAPTLEAWESRGALGCVPERPLSASALQTLLNCPHRFFTERVLRFREPVAYPQTDRVDPAVYGAIFHLAAEGVFKKWGADICAKVGDYEEIVADARELGAGLFDREMRWQPIRSQESRDVDRERMVSQVEALVHQEWEMPARLFVAAELSFGHDQAVALNLDEETIFLRGAIDRLDQLLSGGYSLRDLKTNRLRDLAEEGLSLKRDLQIGLYSLVLESGVLSGVEGDLEEASYLHPALGGGSQRRFTGADLSNLKRRTQKWLSVAHKLLSQGLFPRTPNPDDCRFCPYRPACGDRAQEKEAVRLKESSSSGVLSDFLYLKLDERGAD